MRRAAEPENLALRRGERWRPPSFVPVDSRRRRLMAAVRRFFDLQAGSLWRHLAPVLSQASGTVIDVGCGAQPYRELLPPTTRYIGLDTDEALERFGYEVADVRTIEPGGRWPVRDGEADLVLATETLEHVPDPSAFLAQARRTLRTGGQLIITVPFAARWHYIPHDYWRFTPSGLRLLLEHAGFDQIVVLGRGNETTVACYKALALLLARGLPQDEQGVLRPSPAGVLFAPLILLLTLVANRSLAAPAGDDCLGLTAFARRAPDASVAARISAVSTPAGRTETASPPSPPRAAWRSAPTATSGR